MVIAIEFIASKLQTALPKARVEIIRNPAVPEQASLRVNRSFAVAAARFLRDDPACRFDYASNVTGVDWLDRVVKEKVKVRRLVDGEEREFEDILELRRPGHLEAVYHLYSMELKHGPLVLRLRTENRTDRVKLPSLTPVWRSCEFQEREVYDLYGIHFEGHPDLRRLLMWEGFRDHPMRKDYVAPDDYEYEPTPHDAVLARAREHHSAEGESRGAV
jgi:NADH-quinone oxidoreductase subunit C